LFKPHDSKKDSSENCSKEKGAHIGERNRAECGEYQNKREDGSHSDPVGCDQRASRNLAINGKERNVEHLPPIPETSAAMLILFRQIADYGFVFGLRTKQF
jgi:hypothetical protein